MSVKSGNVHVSGLFMEVEGQGVEGVELLPQRYSLSPQHLIPEMTYNTSRDRYPRPALAYTASDDISAVWAAVSVTSTAPNKWKN